MTRILRVLLVLALATAVLGFLRNWYVVSRMDEEQYINILVKIDRQRVQEDLHRAAARLRSIAGRGRPDDDARPTAAQDHSISYRP